MGQRPDRETESAEGIGRLAKLRSQRSETRTMKILITLGSVF